MLFELYKMFYIDLYDNLILVFLIDNYFLYLLLFKKKKKCVLHFQSGVRLGSKRLLCLSVPHAFTNTGFSFVLMNY